MDAPWGALGAPYFFLYTTVMLSPIFPSMMLPYFWMSGARCQRPEASYDARLRGLLTRALQLKNVASTAPDSTGIGQHHRRNNRG